MHPANYTEIQRVLTDQRSLADAAEAHGTLAGCLCAAVGYRFEDWLHEILPEGRARCPVDGDAAPALPGYGRLPGGAGDGVRAAAAGG